MEVQLHQGVKHGRLYNSGGDHLVFEQPLPLREVVKRFVPKEKFYRKKSFGGGELWVYTPPPLEEGFKNLLF